MARKSIIFLLLLCTFVGIAAVSVCPADVLEIRHDNENQSAESDTTIYVALDRKLAEYFEAIKHEPVEVQITFEGTIAWIAQGFYFDILHGIGNFAACTLAFPLIKLLQKIESRG